MERADWQIEKPRLLRALGSMETWATTLLQTLQDTRKMVETANDDFMFQPESHPAGVPDFEMTMRGIDSPLREILAIHLAIQEHYRENPFPLNTSKLLEKPDFTPQEVSEVLGLLQSSMAEGSVSDAAPIVCIIQKNKIEVQIKADETE